VQHLIEISTPRSLGIRLKLCYRPVILDRKNFESTEKQVRAGRGEIRIMHRLRECTPQACDELGWRAAMSYGLRTGWLSAPARFMQAVAPVLFGLCIDRLGR